MQREPTPDDQRTVGLGMLLAEALIISAGDILDGEPRSGHIAMVAFVHAAARTEVETRKPSVSRAEYRARFHAALDDIMDYEEKRALTEGGV